MTYEPIFSFHGAANRPLEPPTNEPAPPQPTVVDESGATSPVRVVMRADAAARRAHARNRRGLIAENGDELPLNKSMTTRGEFS